MADVRPFQDDDEFDRETDRDEFPSPELEALAEQLADDARMLAERYPAPTPPQLFASVADKQGSPVLRSPGHPHWRNSLAASVLIAAGIGALLAFQRGDNKQVQKVGNQVANELREPVVPQTLPAVSFQEFTGPEQEAVLDLLEENALSQGSLSI